MKKQLQDSKKPSTRKKDEAHQGLTATIKKYGGFLLGEKTVNSIVNSYLNYVIKSPQLLRELLNEAKLSEYVAVKEVVVMLTNYIESQDHGLEIRKKDLEGYFDDAYLISNTVKLLIEADLVAKNNFTVDFVTMNVVEQYVSFVLNSQTKLKLDETLNQMRKVIGVKKKEINWGQVAAVVLGIAAVGAGVGYVGSMNGNAAPNLDAGNAGTGDSSGGAWEDRMAAMSAKYGGGLNFYHPIQY